MHIKNSAIALYIKLINQWIDALKTADAKTLRFIRGNLKTLIQVASRSRYGSVIGISHSFSIHIPDQPTQEIAYTGNIECSWHGEQFESAPEQGAYCLVTIMRATTFRRLLHTMKDHHLRQSSVKALIVFADKHDALKYAGQTVTWAQGDEQDERRHFFFVLSKTKTEGKKPASN